ncbi:MAG: hypothetical protein R2704_13420 [Microthrixaceae bacterium]
MPLRTVRAPRPAAAALLAVLMLMAAACSLSDEELARQARNPEVASGADATGETASPPDEVGSDTTEVQVIAGLGAPIAQLIDGAGVPGLGDTSTAGVEVSADQQTCLEREASMLDPVDIRTLTTNGRFVDLTLSGTGIVSDAISSCIPPDVLGARIAEEYVTRLGADETKDEVHRVHPGGLDAETGDLVIELARRTADGVGPLPKPVTDAVDPCGNTHLEKLLINHYANEGYDFDGAACITFGFMPRITLSDLIDLGGLENFAERLSPTLTLDLEELLENCGPKKDAAPS